MGALSPSLFDFHSIAGTPCTRSHLEAHWTEMQRLGIDVPEVVGDGGVETGFAHPVHNLAEGGTNVAEFVEEVLLAAEAARSALSRGKRVRTVCQTGFNTGVSALALLCATRKEVIVHSFDLGEHSYVHPAAAYLESLYPGRHRLTLGSSLDTLPAERQRRGITRHGNSTGPSSGYCDYVFIDGGHTFEVAMADIRNFRELSAPQTTVAVENCNAWGMNNGWGGMAPVS